MSLCRAHLKAKAPRHDGTACFAGTLRYVDHRSFGARRVCQRHSPMNCDPSARCKKTRSIRANSKPTRLAITRPKKTRLLSTWSSNRGADPTRTSRPMNAEKNCGWPQRKEPAAGEPGVRGTGSLIDPDGSRFAGPLCLSALALTFRMTRGGRIAGPHHIGRIAAPDRGPTLIFQPIDSACAFRSDPRPR